MWRCGRPNHHLRLPLGMGGGGGGGAAFCGTVPHVIGKKRGRAGSTATQLTVEPTRLSVG